MSERHWMRVIGRDCRIQRVPVLVDRPLDVLRGSEICLELEEVVDGAPCRSRAWRSTSSAPGCRSMTEASSRRHEVAGGRSLSGDELFAKAVAAFDECMVFASGGGMNRECDPGDGRIDHRLHQDADVRPRVVEPIAAEIGGDLRASAPSPGIRRSREQQRGRVVPISSRVTYWPAKLAPGRSSRWPSSAPPREILRGRRRPIRTRGRGAASSSSDAAAPRTRRRGTLDESAHEVA